MRTKRDQTALYKQIEELQRNRVANLRKAKESAGTWANLAKFVGLSEQFLAQLCGSSPQRQISEKVARKIEANMGVPFGWLDQRH